MKAIVCERYGSPDLLQLKEVEKPTPKDHEVLVEVQASSVNSFDWHRMRGQPFLVRMGGGFLKPKDTRLGADFSGRVEAVGRTVTQVQPGAEVFGFGSGAFGEYLTIPEAEVAVKPVNLSFEASAAVPMAGLTALQGLQKQGQIKPGQKVLINGASGGVGSFAVQIARAYGAEVTGVCSPRNQEKVRGMGADHVIDYTREDFTKGGPRYDLILDAVGNHSTSEYKRAWNPGGVCVVVGFTGMARLLRIVLRGKVTSKTASKKVGMMMTRPSATDRSLLTELLESGKVVPVIDRRYPLAEVPEAIRYHEEGHAQGKVVITVGSAAPP